MPGRKQHPHQRRAATIVMVAVMVPVLLAMAALTVDVGYLYNVKAELQNTADAAALAAVSAYSSDEMMRVRMSGADPTLLDGGALQIVMQDAHAAVNRVCEQHSSLGSARTVVEPGDIGMGWIDTSSATAPLQSMAPPAEWNAVQITVRRGAGTTNGPVELLFAPIFGRHYTSVTATAVAVFDDRFERYDVSTGGPNVLPFTMDRNAFEFEFANGGDGFAFDDDSGAVQQAPDGISEVNPFPGDYAPGNFGLLNIGIPNNGSSELSRQIADGVSSEELEIETGYSDLTFTDEFGDPITYEISGNPGMKSGLEADLLPLEGQIIAFFLHEGIVDNGSNAVYTIVGIRFGRLMHVNLRDSGANRGLWIQPVSYDGPGIYTDPGGVSVDGNVGRVMLAR